jgi:energy-coupling factor transport system substrate-specific component
VLYRFFHRWQFFAGAVVVAAVYPTLAWASFGLDTFAPLTVVLFYLLTLVASAAGMAIGIAVADALRRAGVARLARRRPRASAA